LACKGSGLRWHPTPPSIQITATSTNFTFQSPATITPLSYKIYDLSGRPLKSGRLSGGQEEIIPAGELRSGIYFVQVTVKENGEESVVTEKVLKK